MLNGTFYVSQASCRFSDSALDELCRSSAKSNLVNGVTGFLVFLSDRFFQYLEGSPDATTVLMTRINADPRHEVIRCVSAWDLRERQFSDWSMHLMTEGEAASAGMRSILFSPWLSVATEAAPKPADEIILQMWDRTACDAIGILSKLLRSGGGPNDLEPR